MMRPRIIIIAIHGPYEPWLSILEKGQRKTWMSEDFNSKVINVFGRKINSKFQRLDEKIYFLRWSKHKIIAYTALATEAVLKKIIRLDKCRPKVVTADEKSFGEVWRIRMPDSLLLQGLKNMTVFRHALGCEFDFMVTTITSTYLNVELLENFLCGVNPNRFVGGRVEKSGEMFYQQGSLRIYSRDVVENLVLNSKNYKHWKIEDIAMGDLTRSHYSELIEIPNLTLESNSDVAELSNSNLKSTISYRCKSSENGKRVDSSIMKSLHMRILEL
jgi:hypothetical protein